MSALDKIKEVFKQKANDPDLIKEIDVWVESKCGRSSKTVTVRITRKPLDLHLGEWQGKDCMVTCMKVCARRVGSIEVLRQPANKDFPIPIPIFEGDPVHLVMQLTHKFFKGDSVE